LKERALEKSPLNVAIGSLVAAVPQQVRLYVNIRRRLAGIFDCVRRPDETEKKLSAPMFPDGFAGGREAASLVRLQIELR
jgi:hypothetical protein